jgi:retron-type reverse transcriptase
MKIEQKYQDYIRDEILRVDGSKSFSRLIDDIIRIRYYSGLITEKAFNRRYEINLLELANNRSNLYERFEIHKKSGGFRVVHKPKPALKAVQQAINVLLHCIYNPHPNAHGFVQNRSVVTNAQKHVGMKYVYNIDIKDFFHSIDQARFWGVLGSKAFTLHDLVRKMLSSLCFTELELEDNGETKTKSVLPQGAPTSPIVSNIIAHNLDRKLTILARNYHIKYSRYADDLSFSSMKHIFEDNSPFIISLRNVIESENFKLNETKTRLLQSITPP